MQKTSLITDDMGHCFICGTNQNIQIHHCLHGTANRKKADKYKLIIPLCIYHHTGSRYAVHQDAVLDLKIKQLAQKKFEEVYGHEKYMEVFGKSYITE